MVENIKYYPKSYVMSNELKSFFTVITDDVKLQKQLYMTEKLSDVASIAIQLGFHIRGAEILQSQAGRVLAILEEQSDDVSNLVAGIKPKTGAQWGRGGGGYLDRAGYWLIELSSPIAITAIEAKINDFLNFANQEPQLKRQLIEAKTFNDLALLLQAHGTNLTAIELLTHQAQKILALTEDDADKVADNQALLTSISSQR